MSRRPILLLVLHGLMLVVLGMLVGFPFHEAITQGKGPDAERAWRVAHTSLVGGGTLFLALAAVADRVVLGAGAARFVFQALVLAAWTFVFGFVVGPAVGARGLVPGTTVLEIAVFVAFAAGLLAAFLAVVTLAWGARAALRQPD